MCLYAVDCLKVRSLLECSSEQVWSCSRPRSHWHLACACFTSHSFQDRRSLMDNTMLFGSEMLHMFYCSDLQQPVSR